MSTERCMVKGCERSPVSTALICCFHARVYSPGLVSAITTAVPCMPLDVLFIVADFALPEVFIVQKDQADMGDDVTLVINVHK